jgi:hypothetical protein
VDHLPLIGAMLRERAVQEMLEALGLTLLTGAPAFSRVAQTLAGDALEVSFPRPMDAAHGHANRLGRALDAPGTTGLDRLYGAVISPAIQRAGLGPARLPTDAPRRKLDGAPARHDVEGPRLTYGAGAITGQTSSHGALGCRSPPRGPSVGPWRRGPPECQPGAPLPSHAAAPALARRGGAARDGR